MKRPKDGHGWLDGLELCPECKGSSFKVARNQKVLPCACCEGAGEFLSCLYCNGTGKLQDGVMCGICEGEGTNPSGKEKVLIPIVLK